MTKAQSKRIQELLSVLKAVRLRCLDCSTFSSYEVTLCVIKDCPLYPYRFGTLKAEEEKSLIKKARIEQNNDSVGGMEV